MKNEKEVLSGLMRLAEGLSEAGHMTVATLWKYKDKFNVNKDLVSMFMTSVLGFIVYRWLNAAHKANQETSEPLDLTLLKECFHEAIDHSFNLVMKKKEHKFQLIKNKEKE